MSRQPENILLVQPPYLRFFGSHNDRVPLELCYLHAYLRKAGFDSQVFNADWTGASRYIQWKKLFANSIYLEAAADGHSPLYEETLERILSFEPTIVVLSAADNLTPWVDLGNPYTTAHLSQLLRRNGIYTIGVGPFYEKVPQKFIGQFDALLAGTASPSIVDIVRNRPSASIVRGAPMDLATIPLIEVHPSAEKDDVVMTAIGCAYHCSYCLAQKSSYKPISIDTVEQDILSRHTEQIYFGDAILSIDIKRLQELSMRVKPLQKTYTSEISVSRATPNVLDIMKDLGVKSVKMGVESGDEEQLSAWTKNQTVEKITRAAELVKSYGINLTVYILLGGMPDSLKSAEKTLELCRSLPGDNYVINVLSFYEMETRDFRYDAHFSQRLVHHWGLESIMEDFFALQPSYKPGLGKLI